MDSQNSFSSRSSGAVGAVAASFAGPLGDNVGAGKDGSAF